MWSFNRRKNQETKNVPPEVQEYYATERRERVGVAWLLAFGTLLVTIALALALFFGGRWVYRKVAHKNKPTTGTSQTKPASETGQSPTTTENISTNPTSTPAPAPTPTSGSSTPATSTSTTAAAPTPSTPNGQLTNTGPGDTVAIFLGVTVLGVLVYQAVIRRKLNN